MLFTAYIGIGSNQPFGAQSPEDLIPAAIGALEEAGRVLAVSSSYRTQPMGFADQPAFINAAVAFQTQLAPEDLLKKLIEIEHRYGRDRAAGPPKGPRTLDLDLLLVTTASEASEQQAIVHTSPTLSLPHPEIAHRRFVLAPLTEIAPDLVHPLLGRTIADLLAELPPEGPNAVTAVRPLNEASGQSK